MSAETPTSQAERTEQEIRIELAQAKANVLQIKEEARKALGMEPSGFTTSAVFQKPAIQEENLPNEQLEDFTQKIGEEVDRVSALEEELRKFPTKESFKKGRTVF